MFAGFTRIRPGCRWVHPWSLGSHGFTLGHVEFTLCQWLNSGLPWWSLGSFGFALWFVGFIRVRRVHSGSPCWSLGSSGVIGFTLVRPRGPWDHTWSLGSLRFAMGVVRSLPEDCRVHPGSLSSLRLAPGVVGFIRVRRVLSRSPMGSLGSSGFVGFTRVCPGDRWVHTGSLGSFGFSLGVVALIRGLLVHSGSLLGPLRSLD